MCVCMHVSMYVCMYVCKYVCMHVFVCVCMYVCVYVCMNVCMYAGIYVHELGILGWLRLVIAQNEEERSLTITTASWNFTLFC